jgi:hypothetical protein
MLHVELTVRSAPRPYSWVERGRTLPAPPSRRGVFPPCIFLDLNYIESAARRLPASVVTRLHSAPIRPWMTAVLTGSEGAPDGTKYVLNRGKSRGNFREDCASFPLECD